MLHISKSIHFLSDEFVTKCVVALKCVPILLKALKKDVNTILVHFLHCTAPLVVVGSLKGIQLGVRNEQSLKTHGDLLGLFTAALLGCWCVLKEWVGVTLCGVKYFSLPTTHVPQFELCTFFPTPCSCWLLIPPHKYHYRKKEYLKLCKHWSTIALNTQGRDREPVQQWVVSKCFHRDDSKVLTSTYSFCVVWVFTTYNLFYFQLSHTVALSQEKELYLFCMQ